MSVHHLDVLLLGSTVVLLAAVVLVRLSSRSGLPSLLIYLGIGVAIGQDGLGLHFDDARLTQVLGYTALVVILAEGGLGTSWSAIRPAVPAAAALATVGVAISVAVVAVAAHYAVDLGWRQALLLGAITSSTDAAAVFSVLRRVPLPRRLTGLLEAESGFNDAPVVILVGAFATAGPISPWYVLLGKIVGELAIGLVVGLVVGKLGAAGLRRIALPASGLYPIAVLGLVILGYAGASLLLGSGFLAAYVSALVLGNSALPHRPATQGFADGLAWIAQIGLFVLLGLLVTPHDLDDALGPAVIAGAALVLLARPLSVVLTLRPFRYLGRHYPWRQQALLSWAGLRGAVPIVLATIPVVDHVEGAERLFDTVFLLVIIFTVVQAPTLPWVARRLRVAEAEEAADLGVEAAPLERLHGSLLSVSVPPRSKLHGVEVRELRLPRGAAVTLVVREGTSFVPEPSTVLQRGDEMLVVTTAPVREATERRLRAVDRDGKLAGWLDGEPEE